MKTFPVICKSYDEEVCEQVLLVKGDGTPKDFEGDFKVACNQQVKAIRKRLDKANSGVPRDDDYEDFVKERIQGELLEAAVAALKPKWEVEICGYSDFGEIEDERIWE